MRIWTEDARPWAVWLVIAMAASCALLLALPGETVTTKYVNDLMIFLDGAHRIDAGQVPNRDFHTALGPLNFYLPAIGFWLSGSLGAAMPWGMAGLILLLGPAIGHVVASRMRPAIALPFAAFLILILAMPANVGEAITDLSFGMYYNRIGWAALGALFAMHLSPARPVRGQEILDGLSAALFTLIMVFTKASYGAAALAFLALMLLDSRQRRWVLLALAVTLGIGLLVEAFWRGGASHLQDLMMAGRVSGALKEPLDYAGYLLRHLADIVLFALVVGLSLWRTRSLRDGLFYAFAVVMGLMIFGQNYQNWGILTLYAGAAVAAENLARAPLSGRDSPTWTPSAAAPLLLLAMILPTIVHSATTLTLHAAVATARAGDPTGLPRLNEVRMVRLWTGNMQDYTSNARYLETLREGARLLQDFEPKAGHVFVLDFVSPFSAALGLTPPRGDSAWLHWGRTLDENNLIPPEEMLRDVRIVMEPKVAIEGVTADSLRQGYGAYLDANYDLVRESDDWKIYVSRTWPGRPASAHASAEADKDALSPLSGRGTPR